MHEPTSVPPLNTLCSNTEESRRMLAKHQHPTRAHPAASARPTHQASPAPVACGHTHTTTRDPCTHTNYNIIKPVVSFLTFAQKTQYFHTKTEKATKISYANCSIMYVVFHGIPWNSKNFNKLT